MSDLYNFDDIRPYNDSEVKEKLRLLVEDPVFTRVLAYIYHEPEKIEIVKEQLLHVETISQIQTTFIYNLLKTIIDNTSDGLTVSGIEKLDKNKAYLFISNHRDIILDAALLNFLIHGNGMNTTQIAIGDNLLLYDWINHAVKLNRAFIIKRDLAVRELFEASQKVSHYIRESVTEDNISVWIAQREGRTKDGCDKTQESLLKMLNMSNKNSFTQGFSELNIVPVSISYEIEPCGISKVREVIKRQNEGTYVKTSKEDLKSMSRGIFNHKGRMHFSFSEPVNAELKNFDNNEQTNTLIQQLAQTIDQRIYKEFRLWPNNYAAFDMLNETQEYSSFYTPEQKAGFETMLSEAVASIEDDSEAVKLQFLKLYANPVVNALR